MNSLSVFRRDGRRRPAAIAWRAVFSVLLLVLSIPAFAQPSCQWGVNNICGFDDESTRIDIDDAGNVYIAGTFEGFIYVDTFYLEARGQRDVFVAKFNAAGSLVWLQGGGSMAGDNVTNIDVDATGNVYLTGVFGMRDNYIAGHTDTAYFSGNTVISKGKTDIFLAKYDTDGALQWVKGYGTTYSDDAAGLVCTHQQKILLTGGFSNNSGPSQTIIIDTISFNASAGANFLVAMDGDGHVEWGKQAKYGMDDIAVDSLNNIYVTGSFGYQLVFDSIPVQSVSGGQFEGEEYVAKLNADGIAIWVRPIGGVSVYNNKAADVETASLSVTPGGDIYLGGYYSNCAIRFHNYYSLPHVDYSRIFLARYTTDGIFEWADDVAGNDLDSRLGGMWANSEDGVYVTGAFSMSAVFGSDTLTTSSASDVYLALYDKYGVGQWAMKMGGTGPDAGYGIAVTEDGDMYVTGAFYSTEFYCGQYLMVSQGGSESFLVKMSGTNSTQNTQELLSSVYLYPNPARHTVAIESAQEYARLILYDQLGSVVYDQINNSPTKRSSLDVRTLAKGIYYIRLWGDVTFKTQKLLIE